MSKKYDWSEELNEVLSKVSDHDREAVSLLVEIIVQKAQATQLERDYARSLKQIKGEL